MISTNNSETDKFSKRLVPPHHHHFILNRIKMNQNDRHNIFWTYALFSTEYWHNLLGEGELQLCIHQ